MYQVLAQAVYSPPSPAVSAQPVTAFVRYPSRGKSRATASTIRRTWSAGIAISGILAALLAPQIVSAPAFAATPAFVQGFVTTAWTQPNPGSQAFTSNTTAGDLIVVNITWDAGVPNPPPNPSCSDSQSDSFTTVGAVTNESEGDTQAEAVCYAAGIAGGADTITVTASTDGDFGFQASEYSGVATSSPLDGTPALNHATTSGGTDTITSTSTTTSNAGDLIIGAVESTDNYPTTGGTGFTEDTNDFANTGLIMEHLVQSSPGSIAATASPNQFTGYMAAVLAFEPASTSITSNATASATVDPSFTFTVANKSSACNGESNFVSGAGAASAVALGHLAAGANVSGGQTLTVAGNSGGGFAVYVAGTQAINNLRNVSHNWTDVSGTYASPAVLGAGERFGYTYQDSTSSSSGTNPTSAKFAALTNATTNAVMGSTSAETGSGCVSFDAQASATTPAGSYSATVIYTAIPAF